MLLLCKRLIKQTFFVFIKRVHGNYLGAYRADIRCTRLHMALRIFVRFDWGCGFAKFGPPGESIGVYRSKTIAARTN